MKDYNIQIKIRNNLLLSAMRARGIETAAELSRASGANQQSIGKYLALAEGPYSKHMSDDGLRRLKIDFKRLLDFFSCEVEDIFPAQHIDYTLRTATGELEISFDEVIPLLEDTPADAEVNRIEREKIVARALESLTAREVHVVKERMGFDGQPKTLHEIGEALDISVNRVRQIEQKAIMKLRRQAHDKDSELRAIA